MSSPVSLDGIGIPSRSHAARTSASCRAVQPPGMQSGQRLWSGSLDTELGEAAYVHAVAGTCRKRRGCICAATGRPQGLEAHTALALGCLRCRDRRKISARWWRWHRARRYRQRGCATAWLLAINGLSCPLPGCACRVLVPSRAACGGARRASEEGSGRERSGVALRGRRDILL